MGLTNYYELRRIFKPAILKIHERAVELRGVVLEEEERVYEDMEVSYQRKFLHHSRCLKRENHVS
jgi:hypothetical protein